MTEKTAPAVITIEKHTHTHTHTVSIRLQVFAMVSKFFCFTFNGITLEEQKWEGIKFCKMLVLLKCITMQVESSLAHCNFAQHVLECTWLKTFKYVGIKFGEP
jgi:hypothetical protein